MSEENTGEIIDNQSNLLQSAVVDSERPPPVHSFDDVPIGGKKFEFSEFPEQGEQPKQPRRPFKPRQTKTSKKPENQQATKQNEDPPKEQEANPDDRPISVKPPSNFDEMPIGGGKKVEMSEYPQEGQALQPAKKPTKTKTTTKPVRKDPPVKNPPPINVDDMPIGGEKPANIDQMPIGGGSKAGFDQQPIGKANNNFMMSQFPEGQPEAPVQTNYTMAQKIKSKAVKLRLSGFEDLLQMLKNDADNPDILDVEIGKLLKETNPACLQKILQCYKEWVEKDKKWGDDEAKTAIQSGYINGKPNTKKLTIEIVDLMFEKAPDCVEMTIMVGLKGKVPKILAGYEAVINELLAIYGMAKMKYMKPYMPSIVTVLNREKLAAVKNQGMILLKQCYKWLGKDVVDLLLKDLKENLKKELDTFWEGYDKSQKMTAPKDIPDETGGKQKKKVDAYELSQAVDIFKKFNEKFSDQVLKQQKWSEKVKLMQDFVNSANVPKLANTQHRHITEMIRRLINHSNFNVVLWDLKIMAVLAKGLRRPFAPVVRAMFSNVIGKFRDKKTQMVDQTFNTLNQFSYCISIEDVLEDVRQGLGDKAPNMKVNLINWIGRFVEKKIDEKDQLPDKTSDALRALFPTFQKLLTDGVAEVRDTMVKNIGKMKILLGDDFFSQVDKKMSKGQASKVSEVKRQMPARKVSKDKNPSDETPSKSKVVSKGKKMENTSEVHVKGHQDLNEQISNLLQKFNHSDWQKRKESAEAAISLLQNTNSKFTIGCLNDFLNALKQRIADPNKNIIKYFVQLTGIVFELMTDKDVKANIKSFICALADGLSDKVQANRRQISITLNKLGQIYGREYLVTTLGSYLDNDKDLRLEVIRVILDNEDYIMKADTREFPKGLIKCLCDRNKEIRKQAQKLFERIQEKTGLDIFKTLARNQRPAIAKDLNTLFSKYQGNTNTINNSSIVSKGQSPPKKVPPLSNKKNQRSLGKSNAAQRSFDRDLENDDHQPMYATMNNMGGNILRQSHSFVQGNEQFAPLKVLASQRVIRQQKDERYPWMCDNITESQQQELVESINLLFKQQLGKKMLSLDHRKVIDAASQIIRLCKDIAHQNQIRQVYDLLFKWVFVKLWGGNPAVHSILEVLPPVMSILQKKKLAMNDGEVDIIVAILREYFITGYMNEYKVSESLYTITKCLIALSSGDRLLKKFLRQFGIELPSIHRHIRKEATGFYREGLSKLIKSQLMEYIGNGSTLEQASRIKQLKNDPEFVDILYKRFHENVLDSFGFKQARYTASQLSDHPSSISNNSTKLHVTNQTQPKIEQKPSKTPPQKFERRADHTPPNRNTSRINQHMPQQQRQQKKPIQNIQTQELDISMLPIPHQASPLGKNLTKLLPPNENTVNFFNSLFLQSGEKISNELITHAKVIFGSILQSVIYLLQNRSQYAPDKIYTQITLLQHAIKCKYIIKNIGEYLYHGTKFALTQLVYEDENKNFITQDLQTRGFDFQVSQFIKVINGVMLRILENACPQEVVNIFLKLLNYHSSQPNPSQKTISLIIKCMSRVTNNYSQQIIDNKTTQFFQRILEYFSIMQLNFQLEDFNPPPEQRLRPEQNIIKNIKSIINELSKNYGTEIWIFFENAAKNSEVVDYHSFISNYLQALGIPYPENIEDFVTQDDEILKQINQLLSKTKTFEKGIEELRKYTTENEGFSPVQYFTSRGYDQKFIIMVMNALERQRSKRTPTKRELREERSQNARKSIEHVGSQNNIQERIQKLKKRFDDAQPGSQNQEKPRVPTPSNGSGGQKAEEDRALEIKRRIDEMKSRMARK